MTVGWNSIKQHRVPLTVASFLRDRDYPDSSHSLSSSAEGAGLQQCGYGVRMPRMVKFHGGIPVSHPHWLSCDTKTAPDTITGEMEPALPLWQPLTPT